MSLTEDELRQDLVQRGVMRVKEFSWEKYAKNLLYLRFRCCSP
jgi:hypothetical protein